MNKPKNNLIRLSTRGLRFTYKLFFFFFFFCQRRKKEHLHNRYFVSLMI